MNILEVGKDLEKREFSLKDDSAIYIESGNKEIFIEILESLRLFLFVSSYDVVLHINIKNGSKLVLDGFGYDANIDMDVKFFPNSYFDCAYSCLNENDHHIKVSLDHEDERTNSFILIHGLNLSDDKLDIEIDTNMNENSKESRSRQESKIILLGKNCSTIKPNLHIKENCKMQVSHSAYLGRFKEEEMFYLESRGLNEKQASWILAKGFLLNGRGFNHLEKDKILKKIIEVWR